MIALHESQLLNTLRAEDQRQLQQIAELRTYFAGEEVFKEGDPGDGLYVIGDGSVKICITTGQTEHKNLSLLGPGEYFGEMAVIDNEPRSATVIAAEDARLYFLPRQPLLEQLNGSPGLAFGLLRTLSRRMRDFNRQYLRDILQAERLTLVGRFARSIVHDFKNPLAIIGLAAEMGLSESSPLLDRRMYQQRIRKQIDRLTSMINELLEFTRGSRSTTVLALTNYAIFVEQTIQDIRSEIVHRPVTLSSDDPPPAVRVLMDPCRLNHVFCNLINNAIQAMPEGGQIHVRFQIANQEVITEICDTGPGIAPPIINRLFEPFATYGKPHGTGLGLSICRRIIEDHRGHIEAHNDPAGGAVFSFALPLPEAAPDSPAAP